MLCGATQDGQVMEESSDKMWSTGEGKGYPLLCSGLENSSYFCFYIIYILSLYICLWTLCLFTQLCLTVCDPIDSSHGDSLGKNTGMSYQALLQGIFPTQGLNPGLPHCRWILYHLSHQGSP